MPVKSPKRANGQAAMIKKKRIIDAFTGKIRKVPLDNISLSKATEELIEEVRGLRAQGLARSRIADMLKKKLGTITHIFEELDRRAGNTRKMELVKQMMNDNFTEVKEMAAKNIVDLLYEGDTGISKWVMEKGFGGKKEPPAEEVFGNDNETA